MSLPNSYFDRLYEEHDDPWGFRDRHYEARKRGLTLASLAHRRYDTIFEPGCSIGVLTAGLAERSSQVFATDPSQRALDTAASHLPPHVELSTGTLPGDWPGPVELIVLSEVGYYLDEQDCRRMAVRAFELSQELIAVHWRHAVEDYPLGGDRVHALLREAAERAGWHALVRHEEPDFLIESWRPSQISVAGEEGLVVGGQRQDD